MAANPARPTLPLDTRYIYTSWPQTTRQDCSSTSFLTSPNLSSLIMGYSDENSSNNGYDSSKVADSGADKEFMAPPFDGDIVGEMSEAERNVYNHGVEKFSRLGWKRLTVVLIVEAIALGSLSIPQTFAKLGMVAGVICCVGLGIVAIYTSYIVGQVKLMFPRWAPTPTRVPSCSAALATS